MTAVRLAAAGVLRSIGSAVRRALGLSVRRPTEDRRVLEEVILPAYARRADIRRVLFVGCAAYTQPYEALFAHSEYWTIDAVPRRRRYGSRNHIVDRLENLGRHVPAAHFDLIICNGVLGWGLNERSDANTAFAACHQHLREAGELVIGWNDVAPRNRVVPSDVAALRRFESVSFEPLQTAQFEVAVPHRHVFNFYRKGRSHLN